MNKKIASVIIFVSLFGLTSFTLAQVTIPNPLGGVNSFYGLLINIAYAVGGLVASLGIIMIMVAGILYLTSAGSPEKMATAKKALVYAIIGIFIGLASTAIIAIIKEIIGAPT